MMRSALTCFGLALATLAPSVARAEGTPLSAIEFAGRVTGKTIYFEQQGRAYGAETYRPDGTVTWRFSGEACREGRWYPDAGAICFVYDYAPTEPQCWFFFDRPEGLVGRVVGDDPQFDLLGRRESPAPLICDQPFLGA
jgi:hypothetical protein